MRKLMFALAISLASLAPSAQEPDSMLLEEIINFIKACRALDTATKMGRCYDRLILNLERSKSSKARAEAAARASKEKDITPPLVVPPLTNAEFYDTKKYCKQMGDAAGGSYRLEQACRELEQKAKTNLGQMTVPARIEKYCAQLGWAAGGSYRLKEACIKQEIESKKTLD